MAAHTKVQRRPDERSLLLPQTESATLSKGNDSEASQIPAHVAYSLCISHFLSTWNSRVFEFGAVLFLASIYPGTLLPMSIYALSRGLSAIIFAPAIGQYIDASNRLHVVRLSIVLQRLAVTASCVIFFLLSVGLPMTQVVDESLLAVLAILACTEKLGSIMNLVAVERDWVVVIAGEDSESLKGINAQMRRIDLVCKLIGPLFIASIDSISTEKAVLVNLVMNIASVVVEYFSIAKVYYKVPELQEPKMITGDPVSNAEPQDQPRSTNIWRSFGSLTRNTMADFRSYARHHVFLPSFTGAILYLTVLSFSGQMVTWLLSTGYDSAQIAVSRTFSVAFEILATWVAPWLMGRIGVVRAGLWFASWQVSCLAAGMAIFWKVYNYPLISATGLVGGTILSRVGLRGFDLCVQIIVQEGVEAELRGSFSTTEAAWQNLFDMCSYICTIVFSNPDQFKWPALISTVAVALAGLLYAFFCTMERSK